MPIRTLAIALSLSAITVSHAAFASTLYDDLGGEPVLKKIVDVSVELYTTDDRIKDQFDNINLDRLKSKLHDQFCELIGGPCHYHGRDMASAHKGLHLNDAQFNALVEDLQIAMTKAGVGYWTQNRFLAVFAPMERQVVTQ